MIDIQFPAVEVLDCRYPLEEFKIDSAITDNAFLNRLGIVDMENFYRQAELDIRENLQYTGIIERTQVNTTRMMKGLLQNLGYEEIYISFKEVDELFKPIKVGKEDAGD